MKKFLSLVLSLVMTMSLVTIGAGATEYKDLTDKSEIKYEEAVAVLNKIGVITGYEDGSFKPAGNLTRGAAAKIIVSLMIGPTAASNLSVTAAPYKDVPVTNTFAAYIAYCKTSGYISGYGDNTFRPSDPLTGYAFAKMLLGAVGYDSKVENFTGSGWTMNVARLANKAGLLNDIIGFSGNTAVTREVAAQLSLNTLKATEVEYTGTAGSVVIGDTQVNLGNSQYSYVVSNNDKINQNINKSQSGNNANYYTLEFGEEHFPDLVLDNVRNTQVITDAYGRPSNQWSFKNVKIGTYAITADYTFTKSASGDTPSDKVKDMGLKDYKFDTNTVMTVNGRDYAIGATLPDASATLAIGGTTDTNNAKILAGYVKNGSKVEVYLSDSTANLITNIAVTQTQVMQINRVTTADTTLKRVESSGLANAVNAVKNDESVYNVMKDLKADDFVVVTPLYNGSTYDVDAVFIPTTATGNITKVNVNSSDNNTSALTVGGTEYKMSRNWTAEDANGDPTSALNGTSVTTRQESTVYIDAYGYAIYVANVKASTSFFMFDEYYSNVVNNRIHYFAQGWDTKGSEVSLDFGTSNPSMTPGKVYAYKVASSNSNSDYQLDSTAQANKVFTKTGVLAANDTNIDGKYFTSGVKFIFPTWENGEITGATVKDGAQKVTSNTYQYVLNGDNNIVAVFLADDKDVEVSQNVLYVQKQTAVSSVDGKDVSVFTGYINGEKKTDLVANKKVSDNTFYAYSVNESTGVYTVSAYTSQADKATAVITGATLPRTSIQNNAYVNANGLILADGSTLNKNLNMSSAVVVDLRDGGTISSAKDMFEGKIGNTDIDNYTISLVYNDSTNSSSQGRVAYVYITSATTSGLAARYSVADTNNALLFSLDGTSWAATVSAIPGATVYLKAKDAGMTVTSISFNGATLVNNVYQFTLGSSNVSAASTVNGVKLDMLYFSTAGQIRMQYTAAGSGSITSDSNGAAQAAYDYMMAHSDLYKNVQLNYQGANVSNISFTDARGYGQVVPRASILAGENTAMFKVTVNNTAMLIASTDGLDDALTEVGITGAANYFVKKTVTAGTVSAVAANDTNALANGDVIDTNGSDGFIKVTTAVANPTNNATTALPSATFGTVTAVLNVTSGNGFVVTSDTYVKKGASVTITMTVPTAGTVITPGVKATIALANGTVGGTYATATAVPELATGAALSAGATVVLPLTIATATGASGALTVTLADI